MIRIQYTLPNKTYNLSIKCCCSLYLYELNYVNLLADMNITSMIYMYHSVLLFTTIGDYKYAAIIEIHIYNNSLLEETKMATNVD